MYDDEMLDAFAEEMCDYEDENFIQDFVEFHRGDYDETRYYEDWDKYEVGFDPYLGCYTDDC